MSDTPPTVTVSMTYEEVGGPKPEAAGVNPMDLKRGTIESEAEGCDQVIVFTGLEDGGGDGDPVDSFLFRPAPSGDGTTETNGDTADQGGFRGPPFLDVNGDNAVGADGNSAGSAEIEFVEISGGVDDGGVTAMDALQVINEISRGGAAEGGDGKVGATQLQIYHCPSSDEGDYWFVGLPPGGEYAQQMADLDAIC